MAERLPELVNKPKLINVLIPAPGENGVCCRSRDWPCPCRLQPFLRLTLTFSLRVPLSPVRLQVLGVDLFGQMPLGSKELHELAQFVCRSAQADRRLDIAQERLPGKVRTPDNRSDEIVVVE